MIGVGSTKSIVFAVLSVALGLWAFKETNAVSGPHFEPIVKVCTDPSIPIDEFAEKTGYHEYEPLAGFGVLNVFVCLITQFLLDLRQTYPEGILTWGGVILAAMPFQILSTLEAGRAGAKGPIRYPLILGLVYQLVGISVGAPLFWIPSYIFGRGTGGVSVSRALLSGPMAIPGLLLTAIVFSADTDSYLWTACAGTLGGPGLPLVALVYWFDSPPAMDNNKGIQKGREAATLAYKIATPVTMLAYFCLVFIAYSTYGTDLAALWNAIWINANAPVAFMTIDVLILYLTVCIYIGFRSWKALFKTLVLSPFMGPAAACWILAEIEEDLSLVPIKTKSL